VPKVRKVPRRKGTSGMRGPPPSFMEKLSVLPDIMLQ